MKLSVLMPVYNEKDTILDIIRLVKKVEIPKEIIIVDDCSKDGTRDVLKQLEHDPEIRVFYHETNQGKGGAIHTAIRHIQGDIAIIQDADLEYDPNDYYRVLFPIVINKADVVYGSRFISGCYHRVLFFWHSLGNRFLTFFSNVFTNLNFTDMETCYKAFRREVIQSIPLEQKRFGFEVEITSKLAKRPYRLYEVGISYSGRTYNEGKKITWKDGLSALYLIIKYH
ncbi:MAG: glycosyltransferase family 2 protein [Candidatus Delongbacteria bacterium]|nr:glycosyltransferase family 2 protein [Candidatus Delongbacteria bacterium]